MSNFEKGDKRIYEQVHEGVSFYHTVGEIYLHNRIKAKVHNYYNKYIEGKADLKILDVGCYVGTDIFMLPKTKGFTYVGIDVSESVINQAKVLAQSRNEKNIEFKIQDANGKFAFRDEEFDIIICLELLEHVQTPIEVLKEMKRILKPEGKIIMSTPNADYIMNKVVKFLPKSLLQLIHTERIKDFTRSGDNFDVDPTVWDEDAHISLFGYNKWRKIVRKAGLVIKNVEGSSFFGGSRYISDRPFLLGLAILADSIIDRLPFKPHLQMNMIMVLGKD
jgi:ubiquinone biosynthesis O-methyltransferase